MRPRLVVIAAAWPFPGDAGQQQRVRNKLIAWRPHFHLTFVTFAPPRQVVQVEQQLSILVDDAIVLPSRFSQSRTTQLLHYLRGSLVALRSGLKLSNYIIGTLELTHERIVPQLENRRIDIAVFEYWHTFALIDYFQKRSIPTILDMHNLLWQSYDRYLTRWYVPHWYRKWAVEQYRAQEEASWQRYDCLITINRGEHDYVAHRLPGKPLIYAPMGIDLKQWAYCWEPAEPVRIAYYGGLGSRRNQQGAWRCYRSIMPYVWEQYPDTELWFVGGQPPGNLQKLVETDCRVHVTGYVEEVQDVLRKISLVLCPWDGRFGFRSRLIEVMATGVPVVTTPDAVHGMGLEIGEGLWLHETDHAMAEQVTTLLKDQLTLAEQSRRARMQVERVFGFEQTYGRLSAEVLSFLRCMPLETNNIK